MNKTYVRKHFLQAGIAVMLCIILMIPSFQALTINKETVSGKNVPLPLTTETSQSFTFTVQVPTIDISDVTGDDGCTYQKISIPDQDSFFPEDAGGPQLPCLNKYVIIPYNAKDLTVQVQTDGPPTVYHDILAYPCPKSIEKTDDGGNKYLAEEFCFDETKYASQHSAPENQAEILEVGSFRSIRMVSLNVYPVSYIPSLRTVEVTNSMTITVGWSVDQMIKAKRDTTKGFEKLIKQVAMNYEENNGASQKTQSATRGSAVFITGSQLRDTTIDCDYLVITHQDFFSNPILDYFVNYRATYGNLDVVVVQTSDIYAQFPNASGDDYSIKDFVQYTYENWQTAPQYLLIVGDKTRVPSHQTPYILSGMSLIMDDEKWYVCVAGSDDWADMAMGRFSVENEAEIQSIYDKIVYYEQHQLSDKPFFKKALVIQGGCVSGEPVYNTVFNTGFTTAYLHAYNGNDSQDIVEAINDGQDIVSYTGHGWQYGWEIFSTSGLPQLTNTIFPIVLTTACSTADLDYDSLGEQFVNIENKGAVAYYGSTDISSTSPGEKIVAAMFDDAEFHLGKAIMYGEFMYRPDYDWWHKTFILLGDPALQSFGYPENNDNLPDLTVSSSGVNYDCFTQQLTINVSNVGTGDAHNVLVNVDIIDENAGTNILLGSHVFSVVPAGGEIQSVTLSDIAPPVNGDYSVVAIADPENTIEESFELNNYNGRRMMISPTFIDITSSSGIYAYTKLVVRGDVNRDGYPDVYLTGRSTPTTYGFLYLNDGDGTFTDITTAAGVQCANVSGAVFGDVDNDGNTDLYISSGNGDHLFRNRGDGTFEDTTTMSGVSDVSSDEAIFGDVDNDGDLDLLVMKHQPPRTILYMNNGDGTFTDETNARGLHALNSGDYVNCPRFVDLDNDGDLDLLVDHASFFIMCQNDGSGFFTRTVLCSQKCKYLPWFSPIFFVSDIDNDGDLDLIFEDNFTHPTFLVQNDDHSFTVRRDSIFGRLIIQNNPLLFAEIDNSPGEDLLSVRGFPDRPQQATLLRNSKTGLFNNYEYLPINSDYSFLAPCVLDIDRDGDNDMIYGNYLYLEPLIKVLKNQVNDQNWLDVQPIGRISNRDAIGTKVYIYSSQNELIGFQEITSQRPVPLHFGLNGTEGPYDIVIQWPASEITDVLQQVSPAQYITVTEGSTLSSLFVNAGRPYTAILGYPIHFRGIALGEEPYIWYWDFGDNSSSDLQNPCHNYTQAGVYMVTLTVTDSLGMIANDTTTATITTPLPLIADANGLYAGFAGESIDFCGSATGGVPPYTAWYWDFGDGTDSTLQYTCHTYTLEDTYIVTLTVTDYVGTTATNTTTITITIEPLVAHAGDDNNGAVGESIQFQGSATGGIQPYTYVWDFGDNIPVETQQYCYHSYQQAGIYTVTLTVTDSLGMIANDTTTATITIPLPLIADANGPYTGITGESIDFCGSATGGVPPYTAWYWDFGDGTDSTLQYTCHTYTLEDTYIVTLTVTDYVGTTATNTTTAVIYLPLVHNLNKGTYYLTIQAAIDDADPGNTIHVNNGTYYENIYIWQPLTLIGENKETTIIDGGTYSYETVGLYDCSDIVIHQFTIKNGSPGIRIYQVNHITISDCFITDATNFGIYIWNSNNITISLSTVTDIEGNGYGIWLFESPNNTISQNLITRCNYGICLLKSSSQNNIYENTIQDNRITGIKIQGSAAPTINNRLYHNTFINNTQNAYDTCNNIWYNATTQEGNYWDDYNGIDITGDGVGDTPYNISGGSNQDLYPLMNLWVPIPGDLDHDGDIDQDDYALFQQALGYSIGDLLYNPEADYNNNGVVDLVDYQIWIMYYSDFVTSHTDILISEMTAKYIPSASTNLSAVHNTPITINLTAIIKNNGTIDITTPFQVSFYGIPDDSNEYRQLGSVLIPSLAAGTTKNISINTMVDPAITAVLVVADSTCVVSESNETNNQATISLPHHILWKSLTETKDVYKELGVQYKVPSAKKVVQIASDGLAAGVYIDPVVFMRTLKTVAKLEGDVGGELNGQVHNELLQRYQDIVKQLITEIDGIMNNQHSIEITWDDAAAVAELQLKVCAVITSMFKEG